MANNTNQAFAWGWTVKLASWQEVSLSAQALKMREQNMSNQWLDPNSQTIQSSWWVITKTNPAPTVDQKIEAVQDPQKKAELNLIKAQQEAINTNKQSEAQINKNYTDNQAQVEASKKEQLANAESFYNDNQALIEQSNKELSQIEQWQISSYEQRAQRDVALVNSKKASEVALLQAEANKQKVDNENAIKDARYNVEIQRQQSAWAYNKIGLSMSSGIINQSQQIATQWIAKIAEIKAQMSFQEAQIDAKVADVEFNYTKLVNDTIDTYSDKIDSIKTEMKKRIIETKKDLLKNSFDKRTTIQDVKDWAMKEKQLADRQHIEDITKVKDRWISLYKDVQESIQKYQERELTKLDTMMQTWTITRLSPVQIAQKERELWLPAWTINAQVDMSITQDVRGKYDEIMWKDYFIWNMDALTDDVRREMKQWRTLQEALEIVTTRDLKDNPDYKAVQDAKKAEALFEQQKKQAEIDKIYWSIQNDAQANAIREYEAQTWRMKIWEDARQFDTKNNWKNISYWSGWTDVNTWQSLIRTSKPSWQISEYSLWNLQWKKVVLDKQAWDAVQWVISSPLFNWVVVWSAFRTSEEQAQLHKDLSAKWATVAKPWMSAHETWMAIDLYSDWNYSPLTPEQVKAMNDAWWYQNAGASDKWHFEYLWTQNPDLDRATLESKALSMKLVSENSLDKISNEDLKNVVSKEEDTIKADRYRKWEIDVNTFEQDFWINPDEEIDDTKMTSIINWLITKKVSNEQIKAYLIDLWYAEPEKQWTWFDLWIFDTNAWYYISWNKLMKEDAFWDTEVYNFKKK